MEKFSEWVVDFNCLDCKVDTSITGIQEYYSLVDEVWNSIVPPNTKGIPHNNGMLCIGCVEARLGRKLTKLDFIDCPLNNYNKFPNKSNRLIDRLTS